MSEKTVGAVQTPPELAFRDELHNINILLDGIRGKIAGYELHQQPIAERLIADNPAISAGKFTAPIIDALCQTDKAHAFDQQFDIGVTIGRDILERSSRPRTIFLDYLNAGLHISKLQIGALGFECIRGGVENIQ